MADGAKKEAPDVKVPLESFAEPHLQKAIDRIGKLIHEENPRIALMASALIVRFARGGPDFLRPSGGWPVGDFGAGWFDLLGNRAG